MRYTLLWDTALGFCGFFAALAIIQAVLNLFRPAPALWPGLVAGTLCLALYGIYRAKRAHLARTGPSTRQQAAPQNTPYRQKDRA